jgi:aspartyl-tRNA synthetase
VFAAVSISWTKWHTSKQVRTRAKYNIAIRNYLAKADFVKEAPLFAASTDDVAP